MLCYDNMSGFFYMRLFSIWARQLKCWGSQLLKLECKLRMISTPFIFFWVDLALPHSKITLLFCFSFARHALPCWYFKGTCARGWVYLSVRPWAPQPLHLSSPNLVRRCYTSQAWSNRIALSEVWGHLEAKIEFQIWIQHLSVVIHGKRRERSQYLLEMCEEMWNFCHHKCVKNSPLSLTHFCLLKKIDVTEQNEELSKNPFALRKIHAKVCQNLWFNFFIWIIWHQMGDLRITCIDIELTEFSTAVWCVGVTHFLFSLYGVQSYLW